MSDVSTAVNGFINNYLNDTPRLAVETLDLNYENADTVFITIADIKIQEKYYKNYVVLEYGIYVA